jgi:hypothetical protein
MMKDGHSHGEFGLEREPSHLPRLHLYYYGMMLVHRIAGCEYSHALTVHVLCVYVLGVMTLPSQGQPRAVETEGHRACG